MTYEEQMEIFRSSCRVYPEENRQLKVLDNSSRKQDSIQEQFYRYVRDDVAYVEKSLETIHKRCGASAVILTWLLFINGMTQNAVAEECHISRRQLQYAMDKWMHEFISDPDGNMTYKDIQFSFRISCLLYRSEKKKVSEKESIQKDLMHYAEEDIAHTEMVFQRIRENYGLEAEKAIMQLLIENRSQEDLADSYHLTRRKIQYNLDKYLKNVLL